MYRPSHRPSLRFRIFPSPFARLFGIKSTPFGNEQYRNQEGKAIQRRNSYQKVINCPSEPRRLIFVYGDAIFALPEAFFFGYSGAIFERSRSPFHCLQRRKICTICAENRRCTKSLFRVVENGKFLKRLRNGHLEKSAATGIFRV